MAAEDRDRLFEKALARQLRRDAGGGDSACPDIETLAAYQEGALSAEEMSAAKKHFGWCARCQEILAQLAATQSVGELRNQEEELAVAGAMSRAENGGASGETSALHLPTRAPKETESGVAYFPTRKKWLLRWAAPAGAIAAGLLLYVGLRDYRSPSKHAQPDIQIAENREDNTHARDSYVAPGAAPNAPQGATPKQKNDDVEAEGSRRKSRQQPAAPAPSALLDELKSLRDRGEPSKDSKAEKKPVPQPLQLRAPTIGANANTPQSGGRIVEQSKNLAKTKSSDAAGKTGASGALQNGTEAQQSQSIQAQTGAVISGAPVASPSPTVPPPAPTLAGAQQVTVQAATSETAAETSKGTALNRKEANLSLVSGNAIDPALLRSGMVASHEKSIWRFGEHGAIAHSSDGGKTWESQQVAVSATLTSGSAPAKNICWIAGAAGTLLRTTDGGKRWQLIIAPIAGDLGGVLASDGKHATIWDTRRQATYQTSNGGKTWEKKPEN
jgi:Photosynthesis system II assembly factor YCF48